MSLTLNEKSVYLNEHCHIPFVACCLIIHENQFIVVASGGHRLLLSHPAMMAEMRTLLDVDVYVRVRLSSKHTD